MVRTFCYDILEKGKFNEEDMKRRLVAIYKPLIALEKETAQKTEDRKAKKEGRSKFGYSDYDSTTPGGLAARLTLGDVGMNEMTFDNQGNAIEITQKFDTNKIPMQALNEFNILNPKTYYKPAEAALAAVQGRGLTTHNVSFPTPQNRMAGEIDITVDNTAVPGPATNYAVQAGDTLTSIAADRGTTVAELMQRNNIANPDLIQIGQMIR